MPEEQWDVVVVGAGPAGSTAAIAAVAAHPEARVLLLDARAFPRDKVCGDGVAPHALDVLAALGVPTDELVDGSEPVTRLHLRSPSGAEANRALARPAYVVRREVLDHRLVEAAVARGVVLRRHTVRALASTADGVTLDGSIHARTVIGADGAESVLRRAVGAAPARAGTVALALRGYVRSDAWPAGEQLLTMTARSWPAYAWAFPIGDGWANVGYGELLRGTPPSRAHLEQRLYDLLPGAPRTTLRGHRLPLSTGRPAVAYGRVLLAGDAASLINPLTGEGIYYAVASGALAGAAAVGADPAQEYRRALRQQLGVHLRHTDLMARLSRWPRVIDAGIAAARDDQRTFDELVEIGLGEGRLSLRTGARLARRVRG